MGRCTGNGASPAASNVVEAPVHRHALLGPQRAQHGDLLLQNGAPLLERHSERVVLHLVPPDAEPEAEAPAAEQVDLGRLLGQQRGLALRPDEDGGGEGQVRAAGQVGEHGQRLAEGVVDRVGAAEVAVHRGVGAEHVVVRGQVGVAEVRDGLPQGADGAPVAPDLGLGEDHADVHGAQSALLPGRRASPAQNRTGPVSVGPVKVRIFVEPQMGATYEQQLRMAQAAEAAGFDAFFRSDHFLTMGGDGLPGPTDSWVTLGAIARETRAHPARHARHVRHVPAPGAARRPGGAGRRHERGTGRARPRRRLVRRRAHRLRRSLPAAGRALRAPRGAVRHRDRALGHARRRDVQLRRAPLPT